MRKMIHEVIADVAKTVNRQEKIMILRTNNTPALREILRYAVHPNRKFWTESVPNWTPDHAPIGLSYSTLYNEYKKLYIFLDQIQERLVSGKVTSPVRKQQLFTEMLESIHPEESKILVSMFDGSFSKKTTITAKLVEEAFPDCLTKHGPPTQRS